MVGKAGRVRKSTWDGWVKPLWGSPPPPCGGSAEVPEEDLCLRPQIQRPRSEGT